MSTMGHVAAAFPRELLSRSKRARREYFRDYRVPHTRLRTVCEELMSAILDTGESSLIFLAGPTGVGKTTLIRSLEDRLTRYLLTELEEDRGRYPFITLEVPAPETSVFPWKDLYKRIMLAMKEPLIGHKTNVPIRPSHAPLPGAVTEMVTRGGRGQDTQDLRRALESVLRHRRPLVCILDEGHHLMRIANGRKLRDQLEVIKSVAELSGVPHLLTGTYDLIPFLDLSGQLSRRSTVIHLSRYQNSILEDASLFSNVVRAFQRHLPLAEEPDLLGQVEYLYQHSLGCVGVLKDWLGRALNVALNEDAPTLTKAHLRKRALTSAQCRRMLSDAREGEAKLTDDELETTRLREELGMTPLVGPAPLPPVGEDGSGAARKPKPFQRKPGRDPVGNHDDHVL